MKIKKLMICVCLLAASAPAHDFTGIFPKGISCISIVAPSSHANKSAVLTVSNELAKLGIKTKIMPTVLTYCADASTRARDIERAWQDPETDLILCSRGGRGGWETAQKLNYEILRARDIPFVGFSNISTLMNAFLAKGVKRPISGPMCTTLVNYPNTPESIIRLGKTIGGEKLDPTELTVLRAPKMAIRGKPAGGHWPSISRMDKSWLPDTAGRIIFLEINRTYNLPKAKQTFDKLKAKGYFERCSAVVLCDIAICGSADEKAQMRTYVTEQVSCPVFSGYPYGHIAKLYAIDFARTLTISPAGLLEWETKK